VLSECRKYESRLPSPVPGVVLGHEKVADEPPGTRKFLRVGAALLSFFVVAWNSPTEGCLVTTFTHWSQ
jgi:hypothetical protein